jgi:hypothetical protein
MRSDRADAKFVDLNPTLAISWCSPRALFQAPKDAETTAVAPAEK